MDPRETDRTTKLLDSFESTFAKVDSAWVSLNRVDSIASGLSRINSAPGVFDAFTSYGSRASCRSAWPATPNAQNLISRPLPPLDLHQRRWLTSGVNSWWSSNAFPTPGLDWVEVRPHPERKFFDLHDYLFRRQRAGQQRTARQWWRPTAGRFANEFWAGISYWIWWMQEELRHLPSAADPGAIAKTLLAVLAAPPGWTIAVRFRVVLEASIGTALERLAFVIAPNAPARLGATRFRSIRGGMAALTH